MNLNNILSINNKPFDELVNKNADKNIDKSSDNALQNKELYNLIKRLYDCVKNNLNYDEYLSNIFYTNYRKVIYKDNDNIELYDENNILIKTISETELIDNIINVFNLDIINESNIIKSIDYIIQLTNLEHCEAFDDNISLSSINLTNLPKLDFLAIHKPTSLISIDCNANLKFASVVNNVSDLSSSFDTSLITFTNEPIKYYGISNHATDLINLRTAPYDNMFIDSNNFIFGYSSSSTYNTNIKNIILSHNVTNCIENCFNTCFNLTSIELPNVTTCGDVCFGVCSKLSSIKLPNVTTCGKYCFSVCSRLSSIELPKVISCGENCFNGCTNLSSVNLPNVTTCGNWCFDDCSNLSSIILSSKVSTIGSNCFQGCKSNIEFKINTIDLNVAQNIKTLIINSGNLPSNPTYWYKNIYGAWITIP